MASNFDLPDGSPVVDDSGKLTLPWAQFFSRALRLAQSVGQAGTTLQRPTTLLWTGRRYFDTDLGANGGKPIWCVDPTASPAVWVDATGAVV